MMAPQIEEKTKHSIQSGVILFLLNGQNFLMSSP